MSRKVSFSTIARKVSFSTITRKVSISTIIAFAALGAVVLPATSADAVAVSADLCRSLLVHPLTDRGIDEFLGDVTRLRRAWPS